MLKKGLLYSSIFFQIILILFMGFIIYTKDNNIETVEGIFIEDDNNTPVSFIEEENHIPFKSYIKSTGVTQPSSGYIKISNAVEGFIEKIFVSIGDEVKINDPIFKITNNSIHVEVKQKEANLNKSVAKLLLIKKSPPQYALKNMKKKLRELSIKKENQEKEVAIFDNLLKKSAISQIENNDKHMCLNIIEKEIEQTQDEYNEINSGISQEEEEIYLNDIEEKKANLKLSTIKLENTFVKAPQSGKIINIETSEGEYLGGSPVTCMTIAGGTSTLMKVEIDEGDIYKIKKNKSLRAIAIHPSNSDIFFNLEYCFFNPVLKDNGNKSRQLEVFFSFSESDLPIFLSQSFDIYLETQSVDDLSFIHKKFNKCNHRVNQ